MTTEDLLKIRRISLPLMKKTKDKAHGLSHCYRVWSNAQKISRLYKKFELDPKILEAACLLHDISYSQYRANICQYLHENKRSTKIASKILGQTSVSPTELKTILQSITAHSHSFPFRRLNPHGSIYDKILQDADTLDFFYPDRKKNKLISCLLDKFIFFIKNHPKSFLNLSESSKIFSDD